MANGGSHNPEPKDPKEPKKPTTTKEGDGKK